MILLDTDHLSVFTFPEHSLHAKLVQRMRGSLDQDFAIPVISVEEQLRGWLAEIASRRHALQQIHAYDRLAEFVKLFADWRIIRFDEPAVREFEQLRQKRIRIGSQDLKIASIALVQDALLLSRNLRDFRRVAGLQVESWIE